jgi:cellobiose phosphorylase
VPFLNEKDPYSAPTSDASVWEHVVLAQKHLLSDIGTYGLSKIHYGDWCDTMNGVGAAGRGESVMLTMQVKWGCELLAELAARRGDSALASSMREAAVRLAAAVESEAWDGAWYRRAFDDNGVPVGTANPPAGDNGEGLIFLNPQSWALISGTGTPERQKQAVGSAMERLDVGYGMVLNHPAYTGLKPRIGQMTAMSPGFYENGSVYVHGNCFWIYGLAKAGYTDEAFKALKAVLPDTPNKPNTDTEPFVIPNYYIGPNVQRRRQRNLYLSGWRTGSAAWLFMTGVECLLGARAEYDGLAVEPRLPSEWNKARLVRAFRGATYDIRIKRQRGARQSVKVDGRPLDGNLVPVFGDGRTHIVDVQVP